MRYEQMPGGATEVTPNFGLSACRAPGTILLPAAIIFCSAQQQLSKRRHRRVAPGPRPQEPTMSAGGLMT